MVTVRLRAQVERSNSCLVDQSIGDNAIDDCELEIIRLFTPLLSYIFYHYHYLSKYYKTICSYGIL